METITEFRIVLQAMDRNGLLKRFKKEQDDSIKDMLTGAVSPEAAFSLTLQLRANETFFASLDRIVTGEDQQESN